MADRPTSNFCSCMYQYRFYTAYCSFEFQGMYFGEKCFNANNIQLQEFEVGRSAIYAMKPGYFRLYFHNLIMQLHS